MKTKANLGDGYRLQPAEPRAAWMSVLVLLLLLSVPATVQAQFNYTTNNGTITITGYTGPGGAVTIPSTIESLPVTSIEGAFYQCWTLTSVTIPNSVTNIGAFTFYVCTNLASLSISDNLISIGGWAFTASKLTSFTIPKSASSIGAGAFNACASLTTITVDLDSPYYKSVDGVLFSQDLTILVQCPGGKEGDYAIPNGVTSINKMGFFHCKKLTTVTIPSGVTNIGEDAFTSCTSLTSVMIPGSLSSIGGWGFINCTSLASVYFKGNAPSLDGPAVFAGDTNAIVYYLPGATGWGPTFGGLPTVLWDAPVIQTSPQTQTAEVGSAVGLRVEVSGTSPLFCAWYRNETNFISCSTNLELTLTNVQLSQSGSYTVLVTNVLAATTSTPARLEVIAPVQRRLVPGTNLSGDAGSLLNLDWANSLSQSPLWTPLDSVSLTSNSQYYFDLTAPLPPQRFYRAWQTGSPSVIPTLDLHMIPALTLSGSPGDHVRVDGIKQFGPTDAWFTLDTVTLTNTSQLYFDVTAPRQPARLYRLVPVP